MNPGQDGEHTYHCPMHPDVRQARAGKCPRCGMGLVPEGVRLGMLRHMMANPLMLAVLAAIMVAIMWMLFM
jgi:hypothetical protein